MAGSANVRIGVAGWTVPPPLADRFAREGSHLERYASQFDAVEINSSFHRPHRRGTYERWAASVPDRFRFAVKLPKTITHERRLRDSSGLIERFAGEIAGLGAKRGPVLVQLPPSLAFEPAVASQFFKDIRDVIGGAIVCEPRHTSWFDPEADALLADAQMGRVAADPPTTSAGSRPGGWAGIAYLRLHGSPQVYRSDYAASTIDEIAVQVRELSAGGRPVWAVFDNTAAGHAPANALALMDRLP